MDEKLTLLSQISLFKELPMEDIRFIDTISTMRPVKKRTLIVSPMNPIPALFLLKKGQVRLYRVNAAGKQFTTDVLTDGNIFGQTSSFALTDSETYVEAMIDTYLCIMAQEEFRRFMDQKPVLAMRLLTILSDRLKDTYDISEQIALADVKTRVLFLLLRLAERSDEQKGTWQSVRLRLTHSDIAAMVGSSRETVSAIMSQLKVDGIVKKRLLAYAVNVDKTREALDFPGL